MTVIKVRLRLYLPHDMDLISLMITHEMDIVKAMYCAISAFVKHDSFAIKIPPLRKVEMKKQHVYHLNLTLDPERDKDVIELLECIEPGYRNNFLKNILRLYLFCPATESFLSDSQKMKALQDDFKIFTVGKRFADAAYVKTRKKQDRQRTSEKKQFDQKEFYTEEKLKVTHNTIPAEEIEEEMDKTVTVSEEMEDLTDLFTGLII